MRILIMRHGQASLRAATDADRPLTEVGCHETRVMGLWLRERVGRLDFVLHSSYLRAEQSWQQLTAIFPDTGMIECTHAVVPHGDPVWTADYLRTMALQHQFQNMLVVSHLPLVGYLVNELLPEVAPPIFPTSGLACVEFNDSNGQLAWLESPHTIK